MNLCYRRLLTGVMFFIATPPVFCEEVEWVTVEPAFRQVNTTGFSRARSTMYLATEVAGKVKQVYADVGETIPPEGEFACLDDTFVNIDIKEAENEIAQHAGDVSFFEKQVSRHKKLVAKKSAAVSQLDDYQRQLENLKRTLTKAKLNKQRLEENRRRHCIAVPAGWRVIERNIEPGQWINIGDPVGKVGDYSHLLVPLSLSAEELAALKQKKDHLQVKLVDYGIQVFASIGRISPAFDESSRKIRVDLLIEDDLPDYRGGMRVELLLELADEFGAFLIAKKALDKRFEEVWLERKNGESLRVKILDYPAENMARIISTDIKTGDQFKIVHH